MKRGLPAFTFVELMVTLAVLAMLIAVLMPTLRAARVQARRTACASNLRQIISGWHMYLDEYDGSFLKGLNVNWTYGGKQGTGGASFGLNPAVPGHRVSRPLNKHLNLNEVTFDADVFHCPADRGGGDVPSTHYDFKGNSYVTNVFLVGQTSLNVRPSDPCRLLMTQASRRLRGLQRRQLHNESKLLLVGDGGWTNTWEFNVPVRIEWHDRANSHNLGFMDGHGEFVRIRKGLHITAEYSVLPFEDQQAEATQCQLEIEVE